VSDDLAWSVTRQEELEHYRKALAERDVEVARLRAALLEACRLFEGATKELATHEDDPRMMDAHYVRLAELRETAKP
jgi:hypothetical protein